MNRGRVFAAAIALAFAAEWTGASVDQLSLVVTVVLVTALAVVTVVIVSGVVLPAVFSPRLGDAATRGPSSSRSRSIGRDRWVSSSRTTTVRRRMWGGSWRRRLLW